MPSTSVLLASLLVLAPLAGSSVAVAQQRSAKPEPERSTRVSHCVVSLIDHVQLSAEEAGRLMALDVKEGSLVEQGQVLGKIDDRDSLVRKKAAELEYQSSSKQAESEAQVTSAQKTAGVAKAEYQKMLEVNSKSPGSVSEFELERLRLTWERSDLQIEVAELERAVAGLTSQVQAAQIEAAENEIDRRRIKSPVDGVVVQRHRQVGEWVTPGEPVLRICRMDRLRVEGFLNAAEFAPQDIAGQRALVEVRLARGRVERFPCKIDYVSPLVEATGEYRVWAEVDNRNENGHWVLRPGQNAEMVIQLGNSRVANR